MLRVFLIGLVSASLWAATALAQEPDTHDCGPCPKTLFSWNLGCENDDGSGGDEEESPLATDRPDFTETSSTVGWGHWQLEAGYTYVHDNDGGTRRVSHSFPETLLRIGIFAEWFELRLGWNYAEERSTVGHITQVLSGSEDMYLGAKLALTEQRGWLPEMALTPQMTVPTGGAAFTAGDVLPGINWLYSWELCDDWSLGGSTQANRAFDENTNAYTEIAQSLTISRSLNEWLGGYVEWYGFFPGGATDGVTGVEHYFNGGFTFPVNPNLQFDVRAGWGLNERSDDFFAGGGSGRVAGRAIIQGNS